MENRGLKSSVWAGENIGDRRFHTRSGDWACPSCNFSNFQRRVECLRCSQGAAGARALPEDHATVKNKRPQTGTIMSPEELYPRDIKSNCSEVTEHTFQGHVDSEIIIDQPQHVSEVKSNAGGLSTSRWAPRNYTGRHRPANSEEIWTRATPVLSTTSNSPTSISPTTSSPPDLGLPYEVQHFILTMIQRMLEEACYDFASRWIPKQLLEKNWTCAEAVELSTWRSVLPTLLPQNSIIPVRNYSLETALSDAVRIRNSAVHRHLCDNVEMKNMALHAQDLTSMFSDATRQGKFYRLRTELHEWDIRSKQDPQGARIKLQEALQEISERPVDDMDWTPNAVSLEEITSSADTLRELEEQYIDEMELD